MRVTLLGHASLLIEMEGGACLMDPVFFDPFEEGAVVSCPRRQVFPERLPPVDIIVLPFLAGFKTYAEGGADAVIRLYRAQRARYALAVIFAEGPPLWIRCDFGEGVQREAAEADVVNRIAASALADRIECEKSFFYVRAHSRRHQSVYEIACEGGAMRLKRVLLPDLLMHYLLNLAPGSKTAAKRLVDR